MIGPWTHGGLLDNSVGHAPVATRSKFDHLGHILEFLEPTLRSQPPSASHAFEAAGKEGPASSAPGRHHSPPVDGAERQNGGAGGREVETRGLQEISTAENGELAVVAGVPQFNGGIGVGGKCGRPFGIEEAGRDRGGEVSREKRAEVDLSCGSGLGDAAAEALEDAVIPKAIVSAMRSSGECPLFRSSQRLSRSAQTGFCLICGRFVLPRIRMQMCLMPSCRLCGQIAGLICR